MIQNFIFLNYGIYNNLLKKRFKMSNNYNKSAFLGYHANFEDKDLRQFIIDIC